MADQSEPSTEQHRQSNHAGGGPRSSVKPESEKSVVEILQSVRDELRIQVANTRVCLEELEPKNEGEGREGNIKILLAQMRKMTEERASEPHTERGRVDPDVIIDAIRESHETRVAMVDSVFRERKARFEQQHEEVLSALKVNKSKASGRA
ncbi:hypothetical protein L218DRAFT_955207 [Marasmius fiardii PR-910]|nr:hypothetical protein L218DRAFT_955207 [Marasmius fiardii PR-910]